MKSLPACLIGFAAACATSFLSAADSSEEVDPVLPVALSPEFNDGYLSLYFDNDLFGGSDENYTNGVRLSWISDSLEADELGEFYRNLDWLLERADGRDGTPWLYQYGMSVTQLMFTPEDTQTSVLLPDQRPYAGWLGVGFSLHARTEARLHTLELSIGVVGPASLAENSQDLIHDLRDIEKAQGWDNQLENELTINLHYRRNRQLFEQSILNDGMEIDALWQWGFDVGNAWINANSAVYLRGGWNLPSDFSDPKLSPTAYTHQLFTERREQANPWSLFVTLGAEGRAVGRDIFLDGNTFEDSPSVDKRHFVADLTAAVTLRYKKLRFSYAHTYRTDEFSEQDGGQVFGSLSVGCAF